MTPKQQLDKIRLNCELPLTASRFTRLFDPALTMTATETSRKALNEQPPLLLCAISRDRDCESH